MTKQEQKKMEKLIKEFLRHQDILDECLQAYRNELYDFARTIRQTSMLCAMASGICVVAVAIMVVATMMWTG